MREYLDTILAGGRIGEHRLLGIPLRPYCLAHAAALERIESPLFGGSLPRPIDILHAGRICACASFPELDAAFDPAPTEPEAAALLRIADEPDAFDAELSAWARYIAATAPVVRMFRERGGRPLAAPPALAMVVRFARQFHLDPRAVWWMPLGELRLYAAAADELDGAARFWTQGEIDKAAELRARGITATANSGAPRPRTLSIRKAKEAYWRRHGRG